MASSLPVSRLFCLHGENVGKGILLVGAVAMLAIGIAGLTTVDFGTLGKLPLYASIPLVVVGTGLIGLALWLILRKSASADTEDRSAVLPASANTAAAAVAVSHPQQTPVINSAAPAAAASVVAPPKPPKRVVEIRELIEDPLNHAHDVDVDDNTALHYVITYGKTNLVGELLAKGVDPNAKGDFLLTPLHHAVRSGATEAVTLLLQKGANPNAQDKWGSTPLHTIALVKCTRPKESNFAPIWTALTAAGGDVNIKNERGQTPMQILASIT